jgi:hypothetical protein
MAQSRGSPLADTPGDGDAVSNDCQSENLPAEAANSGAAGLKAAKKASAAKNKKGESSVAPKGASKSIEADAKPAKPAAPATRADVKCAYSSPLVQFKSYRFSPYYRTKAGESLAAPKHRHGPMLICRGLAWFTNCSRIFPPSVSSACCVALLRSVVSLNAIAAFNTCCSPQAIVSFFSHYLPSHCVVSLHAVSLKTYVAATED